jgi:beta-lactam-binding protein with PASTA domain
VLGSVVQIIRTQSGGFTTRPPLVTVPYVTFMPKLAAQKTIDKSGLVPVFIGPGSTAPARNAWVSSQSPLMGSVVAKGSKVTMILQTGPTP